MDSSFPSSSTGMLQHRAPWLGTAKGSHAGRGLRNHRDSGFLRNASSSGVPHGSSISKTQVNTKHRERIKDSTPGMAVTNLPKPMAHVCQV